MKNIIVVEDDADIREIFLYVFDPDLYQITGYENGFDIINNSAEVPDIFFVDKNIPGSSGETICRHLKTSEKYKGVPVIIFSAGTDLKAIAEECGADDVLAKPFELKALRDMVARYT